MLMACKPVCSSKDTALAIHQDRYSPSERLLSGRLIPCFFLASLSHPVRKVRPPIKPHPTPPQFPLMPDPIGPTYPPNTTLHAS